MTAGASSGPGRGPRASPPRRAAAEAERARTAGAVAADVATGVLVVALVAGLIIGTPALRRRAGARIVADPPAVVIEWPAAAEGAGATWLDPRFQNELLALAVGELEDHSDPWTRVPLERVSAALRSTGWFAAPPVVERTGPRSVRVTGRWRAQAAVVRSESVDHLVAWTGELLSGLYREDESRLPVIRGVAAGPPRRADGAVSFGSPWPGEEVRAALELLAVLQPEPFFSQVRGVDVSAFYSDQWPGRLVIETDRGSRVVWGVRPADPAVDRGEVVAERKLWNLREVYRRFGRIDAGWPELPVNTGLVIVDPGRGSAQP